MNQISRLSEQFGLHPLVGMGMILVDLMLFGGELSSFGMFWIISATVGLLLAVPSALLQRYVYGDRWTRAIGKSLVVGVLTGIPTPLPSLGTATLTGFGIIRWLTEDEASDKA